MEHTPVPGILANGMIDLLQSIPYPWLSISLLVLAGLGVLTALAHVVLSKKEVRAAIGWAGLILVFPFAGAILYAVFGINRIERKASALRGTNRAAEVGGDYELPGGDDLAQLDHLVGRVVQKPLLTGNAVRPLVNGEEAYPAMLEAIHGAERTLTFSTYIFDNDAVGRRFADALEAAHGRGVAVRVIIDSAGARYSLPPLTADLRRRGLRVAVFMPTLIPWRLPYMNLRTHRKILVADGRVAFVGGINVRQGHLVESEETDHPVKDLHFRVEGPVVEQVQQVFADDWAFCTGEELEGDAWSPRQRHSGEVEARIIPDGPDGDFDKLRWTLLGALSVARKSVRVVTPYFLPDLDLITALNVASLRGLEVDVLLPEKNNLTLVQWATMAHLPPVLEHGCRVWLTPPPFDHSKLMVIDGEWALVGSANWDPRSLRLNFEIGMELYDPEVGARLEEIVAAKLEGARRLTAEELEGRALWRRLRDGLARLAQPYL